MRILMVCFLLFSCASSYTLDSDESTEYVAESARRVARAALDSLKARDEKSFKKHLSKERRKAYSTAYFTVWADRIGKFDEWSVGQYQPGTDLIQGTVSVALQAEDARELIILNIRFERGRWRWHHK